MSGPPTPIEVFCSYTHEDEPLLKKLEVHLSLLKRQGLISIWHDRQIVPGTDWAQAIDDHLETASLILLLVSAEFLASDYCYEVEMQRALERDRASEARVLPIIVRPCDWRGAPFARRQCLPRDGKPVTTWDDWDVAWNDVSAGIRRAIEDLSLLKASAPHVGLPQVWNIPYPRNPFFIGRDDLLTRMHSQLEGGQSTALCQPQAISGLGGIGKTQIAVEYAYRYHQDYQVVLWARAESQEALISSYVALATVLNLPERDAQEQAITIQAVKTWLQTHRGWLLILDNADELSLVPAFLPPALGGHLLLTTRAQALGRLARRVEVEIFSEEQGALFLLRRAALLPPDASLQQASSEDCALALQITRELGGLPLALDQAGAYLEETGCSLSDYQQRYQHHRAELLKEHRGVVTDHPEPVATTWSLAFAQVQERNAAAAELLRLCAHLAPEAIPLEILSQGAAHLGPQLASVVEDAFLLDQAIEALRAYSLLARDPVARTLSMHRLMQVVVRESLPAQTAKQWAERTVRAVNSAFPAVEFATWQLCERCLPHALACAEVIEHEHLTLLEGASLLNRVGMYLFGRARYSEAEPLVICALSLREQALGPTHPDVAASLNNLAILYEEQGKYEQAEPLHQRALRIREQHLGPEHPDTAQSLHNLSLVYTYEGRYELAEPLVVRALRIREQLLGPDHPSTANSLNNLAGLYQDQGKYEQAEPLYVRALHIREQQMGPEHPEVTNGLGNLANLYREQGKYEQAELLLQRSLAIEEKVFGAEHPWVANSLNKLAALYQAQGKYERAEPLLQRALVIYERLSQEHPSTLLVVRKDYASLLRAMGRDKEAAALETERRPS